MGFDVAVIGAGVVGLAVAEALQRAGRSVVCIEAGPRVGAETTSRNSEVVHAGLFYPPGSLKTELCIRGNALLRDWCAREGVAFRGLGKWLVASTDKEVEALESVYAHCRSVGVPGLRWLSDKEARSREPLLAIRAALESTSSAIVSAHELCASLRDALEKHGGLVALRHRLVGASPYGPGYRLEIRLPEGKTWRLDVGAVVNAAGLEADTVAAMAGIDVDGVGYRQYFCKGNLFSVPGARGRFSRLIYPIPPAGRGHLGAHVIPDMEGAIRLGPDAQWLAGRSFDYDVNPARAQGVWEEARRYWPSLRLRDMEPAYAGIRPKLRPDGRFADFLIREESDRGLPGWVNLLGMESPGLTAAPAIGERLTQYL